MSWQAVARKDFQDAIRSKLIWALTALFVVLALVVAGAYGYFPEELGGNASAAGLAFFLANVISTFVAITAILISYKAIAGERESGSIKLLLSLPHSRNEVVLGKILGRGAVLAVATILALLLGTILGSALMGSVDVVVTVLLLAVAMVFVLTYVSAMVGFSAMTDSASRAAALGVGVFFIFEMLWDLLVLALLFVTSGFSMPAMGASSPAWIYPLSLVPPSRAFLATLNAVIPGFSTTIGSLPGASTLEAVYATPWLGLVILLLWLTIPLAIGIRRFQRADL